MVIWWLKKTHGLCFFCCWQWSKTRVMATTAYALPRRRKFFSCFLEWLLGSAPRYMIRVTLFCTLCESENTRTCWNFTRFASNSRMSVCFLTRVSRAILACPCVFWLSQRAKSVTQIIYLGPLPSSQFSPFWGAQIQLNEYWTRTVQRELFSTPIYVTVECDYMCWSTLSDLKFALKFVLTNSKMKMPSLILHAKITVSMLDLTSHNTVILLFR